MSATGSAAVSWGQLLRVSLAPTALADVIAGSALAAIATGKMPLEPLLIAASLGIYHGSMALNDWADFEEDSVERPSRPLPSGKISPKIALGAACGLILGGVALAWILKPALGIWMAGIASLAVGYNIWLRGRLSGPLSLGLCRSMHLAAPLVLSAQAHLSEYAPIFIAYGLYVFTLSSLARLETRSIEQLKRTPAALLLLCSALFATSLFFTASPMDSLRGGVSVGLSILGSLALASKAFPLTPWSPGRVQAAVGLSLRLLLVFTAAVALGSTAPQGWYAAAIICAGYPIAHGLRKVFPPT